jgi:hypothetical protein
MVTPAGRVESIVVAKLRVAEPPPPAREERVSVQVDPAEELGQLQPEELEAELKVVAWGTVSRSVTAPASRSPVLTAVTAQTTVVAGVPVPEATALVSWRRGEPPTGVDVEPQLLPEGSPGVVVEAQAVLVMFDSAAGTGEATRTPKSRVTVAVAAGREPMASVQFVPAQVQPGDDKEESKLVEAGRVSVSVTAAALALPTLETARVQTMALPGVAPVEVVDLVTLRSGTPGVSGVESEAVLSVGLASSTEEETEAVLSIRLTVGGKLTPTSTAKIRDRVPATTRVPTERVQVEPAEGLEQTHPGELTPALKVVLRGTVSVKTVSVAGVLPRLTTVRV